MPDRPGALGQVASRIGAVRGDVLSIEVLEQGGGRAIDELTVALPDQDLMPLLSAEIDAVDGVSVENIRVVDIDRTDASLSALALGAAIAESPPEERLDVMVGGIQRFAETDWVMVLRRRRTAHTARCSARCRLACRLPRRQRAPRRARRLGAQRPAVGSHDDALRSRSPPGEPPIRFTNANASASRCWCVWRTRWCHLAQSRERSTARSHCSCAASAVVRSSAGVNCASSPHCSPTSSTDAQTPSAMPAR